MGYELPKYDEMMWPTLLVVRDLGGSATIQEIEDGVAEHMKLSEASLQIEYDSGNGLVFKDRVSWARSHLKKIDALANPSRGIWTLGASAENFTDEAALRGELQSFLKEYHAERNAQTSDDVGHLIEEESSARDWKDELLEVLKAMEPSAFERLCQRVLREHGFSSVRVTGKVEMAESTAKACCEWGSSPSTCDSSASVIVKAFDHPRSEISGVHSWGGRTKGFS